MLRQQPQMDPSYAGVIAMRLRSAFLDSPCFSSFAVVRLAFLILRVSMPKKQWRRDTGNEKDAVSNGER